MTKARSRCYTQRVVIRRLRTVIFSSFLLVEGWLLTPIRLKSRSFVTDTLLSRRSVAMLSVNLGSQKETSISTVVKLVRLLEVEVGSVVIKGIAETCTGVHMPCHYASFLRSSVPLVDEQRRRRPLYAPRPRSTNGSRECGEGML